MLSLKRVALFGSLVFRYRRRLWKPCDLISPLYNLKVVNDPIWRVPRMAHYLKKNRIYLPSGGEREEFRAKTLIPQFTRLYAVYRAAAKLRTADFLGQQVYRGSGCSAKWNSDKIEKKKEKLTQSFFPSNCAAFPTCTRVPRSVYCIDLIAHNQKRHFALDDFVYRISLDTGARTVSRTHLHRLTALIPRLYSAPQIRLNLVDKAYFQRKVKVSK